jgi:hypothetical protein
MHDDRWTPLCGVASPMKSCRSRRRRRRFEPYPTPSIEAASDGCGDDSDADDGDVEADEHDTEDGMPPDGSSWSSPSPASSEIGGSQANNPVEDSNLGIATVETSSTSQHQQPQQQRNVEDCHVQVPLDDRIEPDADDNMEVDRTPSSTIS